MSGDILTVKTVKRVRSVRGSALVHIKTSIKCLNVVLAHDSNTRFPLAIGNLIEQNAYSE